MGNSNIVRKPAQRKRSQKGAHSLHLSPDVRSRITGFWELAVSVRSKAHVLAHAVEAALQSGNDLRTAPIIAEAWIVAGELGALTDEVEKALGDGEVFEAHCLGCDRPAPRWDGSSRKGEARP